MSEARWKAILPVLEEFQSFLSAKVPKLRIVVANDRRWPQERYLQQRKPGIFLEYGVYLIFDPSETLEYVGLAMNTFDDRIWSHDSYVDRQWTDVIPMSHAYYFLAPALEFFLIVRLRPRKNSQYRTYTLPDTPR